MLDCSINYQKKNNLSLFLSYNKCKMGQVLHVVTILCIVSYTITEPILDLWQKSHLNKIGEY
ncbi:hypothetical protein BpHYR1_051658 [Brachionus plicatilis]|uniref:Uncharacterized protein n=1 Tax=Brachionus plicatilis TaxID=10195 RepID=A0A3M7PZ92_BRAPC|nr:hypothetical protein BpHYR1_051658 [Brachionus plicatilis]